MRQPNHSIPQRCTEFFFAKLAHDPEFSWNSLQLGTSDTRRPTANQSFSTMPTFKTPQLIKVSRRPVPIIMLSRPPHQIGCFQKTSVLVVTSRHQSLDTWNFRGKRQKKYQTNTKNSCFTIVGSVQLLCHHSIKNLLEPSKPSKRHESRPTTHKCETGTLKRNNILKQ